MKNKNIKEIMDWIIPDVLIACVVFILIAFSFVIVEFIEMIKKFLTL